MKKEQIIEELWLNILHQKANEDEQLAYIYGAIYMNRLAKIMKKLEGAK